MNHCYRLVFNKSSQVWQVVSELAKSHSKSAAVVLLPILSLLPNEHAWAEPALNALPTGGQVVSGQSAITQNGNQLNILQSTQKSIINWNTYNIGANAQVTYVQPNANAISLNRVISGNPSEIFGKLNSNGQVWLINPNGVLFGKNAQVNVGGIVATTLNIADEDFLNGKYQFTGSAGSVINMGNIVANNGGYVAMLAPEVRNEGVISAMQGTVAMSAGNAITLDFNGNGLINVQVDSANVNTLVENKHLIQVGNGQVLMSTKAADGLITSVINNSGKIEANSMVSDGGVIRLTGAKTVINSGEISATSSSQKGGTVHLLGNNVGMFSASSVNVSGKTGGGTILVGGDYQGKNAELQNATKTFIHQDAQLIADATESGDGGKVIVWANDIARYYGSVSAKGGAVSGNGGFVEISGKRLLNFFGNVDLSAANGKGGNLLLDPLNIRLSDVDIDTNTLGFTPITDNTEAFADDAGLDSVFNVGTGGSFSGITAGSTITLQATNDITVENAFNVQTATGSANNSLVLEANNNINVNVNAAITLDGTGALTLKADADDNGTGDLAINAAIRTNIGGVDLSGVNVTSTAAGTITTTGAANADSGNVKITAKDSINLTAPTSISTSAITASGNNAGLNGGNVELLAGKSITTGVINTSGSGASFSGVGDGGNAGSVSVLANSGITIGGVQASGGSANDNGNGGQAGDVLIRNGAALATNNITVSGNIIARAGAGAGTGIGIGGTAATVNIENQANIGSVVLSSITVNGTGGNVNITTAGVGTSSIASINADNLGVININNADTLTVSGVIAGAGTTVTKSGTGTLVYAGANTYTGATNVNAGTLSLSAADRINDASALTVAAGATFNLNNHAETVGSIAGAGNIVMGTAALTSGGNNSSTIFSGVISGTAGNFNKVGNGTLTLSGNNSYNGVTNVQAGTLIAAHENALGATTGGISIASGAILNVNNVTLASEAITLANTATLTGTDAAIVTGNVSAGDNAQIGTTSAASTLTINGELTSAANNTLEMIGAGSVLATNAANNVDIVKITNAKDVSLRDVDSMRFSATASNLSGTLTVNAADDITLQAGGTITSSAGDIFLTSNAFTNNAGANALTTTAGRWVVHSAALAGNAYGGLNSGNQAIYGRALGVATTEAGNRYVFVQSPTLAITSTDQTKTYGQDATALVANAYTATGFVDAAFYGNVFTQDTTANSLNGSATSTGSAAASNVGSYAIDVTAITATTGYTLNTSNAGNLTVNKATLNLSAVTDTKTYDGSTDSSGVVGKSGLVNGDTVTSLSQSYASKNVLGTNGSILNVDAGYTVNDGNGGNNYTVVASSAAGTITALSITGNITVDNKVYDGNDSATIATRDLTGVVVGDTVTYNGGTATFTDKHAETGKTVTATGLSLSGVDASNYTVNTTAMTTADISKATLNFSAVTDTKVYDGNTNSTGIVATTGLFGGDAVTNLSQSYVSKNVLGTNGSTLNVNAGYTVNDGNGGNNYTVVTNSTTGTITQANLNVTANNSTKIQGATNPAFTSSFAGFVGGDSSAVLIGTLSYATLANAASPVGTYSVTPSGLSANNYSISFVDGLLDVTAITLPVNPENTGNASDNISVFNNAVTRPEQAELTCPQFNGNQPMINGLDAFGADNVDYEPSISQPLVAGVVANALAATACLKL